MIKISLILDELSADPETAIELAASWGIGNFELRGFYTERAPLFTDYQKFLLRSILADYDAKLVAISPGLFKMPYPAREPERWSFTCLDVGAYQVWSGAHRSVKVHLDEILPATLDYANELGIETIVIFGFHRNGAPSGIPPEEVLNTLLRAAERAAAAGTILALETEDGYWTDTGENQARIIKMINHRSLRANWDPGNAFCAGDNPYPTGYSHLKQYIRHVHFKDVRRLPDGKLEFAVNGEIDWSGQIKALLQDGYEGFISIETHQRPKVASARKSFERLKSLIIDAQ
jgi:sugar phosphate isomerase/epimerase